MAVKLEAGVKFIERVKLLCLALVVLPLHRVWKFQRRARDYIRLYLAVGQRQGRIALTFIKRLRRWEYAKNSSKYNGSRQKIYSKRVIIMFRFFSYLCYLTILFDVSVKSFFHMAWQLTSTMMLPELWRRYYVRKVSQVFADVVGVDLCGWLSELWWRWWWWHRAVFFIY
jgi:hypothetical protein